MTLGEWALAALGMSATGLGAAGGLPGLASLVRELRGKRDSKPPQKPSSASPVQESHARRLSLVEDALLRQGEEIKALDRRIDREHDERLDGEKATLREQALTNERLAEMVGRMDGQAGIAPRSRRRS